MSATPRRHKKPLSPARQRIEYAGIKTLLAGLRALPLERSSDLMANIVGAGMLVSARLRHVGMDNLRRAFPEHDEAWCRQVLRGSFRSLGRLAAEVAWFDDLRPGNIHERIGFTSPESEQHWRTVVGGKRQIIATGHFGNWELFAQAQGLMGYPIHIVHRALKNAKVDDLLNELRSRAGTDVVYKHAAAREILRLLRAEEVVALPIDQHAIGTQGTAIPFFGRPAATTTAPVRLSQLTRAPLSIAVLVRRGESLQHDILVRPPIEPPPATRSDTVLREVMTRVNLEFEDVVRQYPEQWLWMHRRWRLG